MAFTRNDLVEEVLLMCGGFIGDQELIGTLSGSLTDSATTFTVTGSVFGDSAVSGFQPGVIEVDHELMYVGAVAPGTGVFSNVIRGFRGTTAATHSSGAVVRDHPRVPRIQVVRALNQTLSSLHPRVYAVVTSQAVLTNDTVFELPTTCVGVLDVGVVTPDNPDEFKHSRRWKYVAHAPEVTSGKCIQVYDSWSGSEILVTYAKQPGVFSEASGTSEDFATATLLPEWTRELVVLGAAYRLVGMLDAGRLGGRTAEGDLLAQQTPVGGAQKLGAFLYAQFQEALTAAELRLRALNDVGGMHYER